ncbi:hypothetical protein Tco_0564262 [Tanacetum coccineum]
MSSNSVMIFMRSVPIPAIICRLGLDYESWSQRIDCCTVGESKMDCKFFSRLIKDHLSLEPQGIHSELPLREVYFLDQKGLVHMWISCQGRRKIQCYVPAKYCASRITKDIYQAHHHNIEAKAIWDNVKMLLEFRATQEKKRIQLTMSFERFTMLPVKIINEYYVRFTSWSTYMRNIRMSMPKINELQVFSETICHLNRIGS